MEHDGRKKTYAKLIQKFMHILVGVSTENARVIKSSCCLEMELIKGEDEEDKSK